MPSYIESTDSGSSESLNGVSMELHSVKNEFRFSCGKMLVSLEKKEIIKTKTH